MKSFPQSNCPLRPLVWHSKQRMGIISSACKPLVIIGLIISVLILCAPQVRAAGTLDPAFGTGGKITESFGGSDYPNTILIQPDGKILVVGTSFFQPGTGADFAIVRYNTNGTLDNSFGTGGKTLVDFSGLGNVAEAALLQPDGKIVIVGHVHIPASAESDFAVARINSNGTLDGSFGATGTVTIGFGVVDVAYDVGLQSNGKIVVVGHTGLVGTADIVIVRYNPNGTVDTLFGSGGSTITDVGGGTEDYAYAVAIQPDDKIVLSGNATGAVLLRYNSGGTLDSSFGTVGVSRPNFGAGEEIKDIALQPDGKIVAAGSWTSGSRGFLLVRYLSNGSLDTGFGTGGKTSTDFFENADSGYAVALRADGKIAVVGQASFYGGSEFPSRIAVALYNSDGALAGKAITDFAGSNGYGRSLAFQSDGKLLIAGILDPTGSPLNNFGVARYTSVSIRPTAFDFDGDEKTDISVYRPGGGSHWYAIRSSFFYTQLSRYDDVQFGATGDLIVPGDYDGDLKTDYAVFRPSTGTWYTSLNPALNFGAFQWGQNGDIPVPGDYDGDGKTDRAIYRPSTGTWWILRSSDGGFIQQPFGTSTDRPVIGDFDGDTKTDFAYVSVTGGSLVWNIRQSSNGAIVTQQFGINTDRAVPADYDGDGITNIAVFRVSTGRWYTSLNPATNYGEMQWGSIGDVPVPGDYDGDGKADLAVYRPSNGDWYVRRSIDALLLSERWGLSTDLPVPSAFIPQ